MAAVDWHRPKSDETNNTRGIAESLQEPVEYQGPRRESGSLIGCESWRGGAGGGAYADAGPDLLFRITGHPV